MIDLKSTFGTILSFSAWILGNINQAPNVLQNTSLYVAIIAGALTVIYTFLKIWEWFSNKHYIPKRWTKHN